MELHTKTMSELTAGLEAGVFTAVELTQSLLERIAAHDDKLNALITLTGDAAVEAAAKADADRAAGNVGALNGLPVIHKDIFCTRGIKTTCGSKMLDNFISPYDATIVARMAAAGAVVLGKSNMDEFAMGSSNETSYFGPVRNPWTSSVHLAARREGRQPPSLPDLRPQQRRRIQAVPFASQLR